MLYFCKLIYKFKKILVKKVVFYVVWVVDVKIYMENKYLGIVIKIVEERSYESRRVLVGIKI